MTKEAQYCIENHKEKVAQTFKYADMFVDHVFLFNTENDLEQLDDAITYDKKIDWEYKPGDDQEYVWQFNRHRYWIVMGQAYAMSGDEKYATEYAYQLNDWIDENPLTEAKKATTWRILEAGFRGEYWTKAFNYFKDSPAVTEELKAKFYDCLHVHARYIMSMHSPYRLISNWGVIENHGLFMISLTLPESAEAREYQTTAIDHLDKLCRMAVMPDGVQWEQSPMYHNEVLKDLLDVVIIAKQRGISLPASITDTVHRMSMTDLIWQKPNHHEFMMGDSDDFDISQYLCKAAICFEDPVLKLGANAIPDFEMVWEVGMEGVETFEKLPVQEPDFTSKALADTGNYYFRSDWTANANLMHFHCGTIGAGHGHSDQLHLDLVIRGEDVLMDGGRYTYVYGDKRREYKDPSMHNTIMVDGELFTICKDSWKCTKLSQPVKQQFVAGPDYEFVQAGHLGYMDRGVFVNRKIVHIKPDIYIIADECYAGDAHEYESFWHFNSEGSVTLEGNVATYHGANADTRLEFVTPGATARLTNTHLSRSYNHEEDNQTVSLTWQGQGTCTCITVITVLDQAKSAAYTVEKLPVKSALKGSTYPDNMAEAIKVTCDDTEYVTILCHQEVNSPTDLVEADGCLGFGNVIVFNKQQATEVGQVLVY